MYDLQIQDFFYDVQKWGTLRHSWCEDHEPSLYRTLQNHPSPHPLLCSCYVSGTGLVPQNFWICAQDLCYQWWVFRSLANHKNTSSAFPAAHKERGHPVASITFPFSVCASDPSGVSPRCCLHSSLQQRATERAFWCPGLIYQVLETLTEVAMPLCHPAPLLSRRLPLPFPSPWSWSC